MILQSGETLLVKGKTNEKLRVIFHFDEKKAGLHQSRLLIFHHLPSANALKSYIRRGLLQPFGMEYTFFVGAFIRMSAEIVSLGLYQIGW